MPTGYTADVGDGKVADFPTWAMRCARAFGALVTMRDSAPDAPIPDEFKPDGYHEEALGRARAELSRLKAMTATEVAEAFGSARAKRTCDRREARQNRDVIHDRYRNMLAKVRAWKPPTPDHQGMRDFMEKQLLDSIEFDCKDYRDHDTWANAQEWLAQQIESASWNVTYHEREKAAEEKRCRERTEWVRALRASLTGAELNKDA